MRLHLSTPSVQRGSQATAQYRPIIFRQNSLPARPWAPATTRRIGSGMNHTRPPKSILSDPRAPQLARVVCERQPLGKSKRSNNTACSLARRAVLTRKLQEVVGCWKRKLQDTRSPGAWRMLTGRASQNASIAARMERIEPAGGTAIDDGLRQRAFERVYDRRVWVNSPTGTGPLSGSGSSLDKTANARAAILAVIRRHGIRRIVDAPCGDLTWARALFPHLEAWNVSYHGVDVVRAQIAAHQAHFGKPGVRSFSVGDLAVAPPPVGRKDAMSSSRPLVKPLGDTDLILCRQALQHLNAYDALRVLHQFSRSGAKMLLTTSYTIRGSAWLRDENYAPQLPGGEMIMMDLSKEPFDLPDPPLEAFHEFASPGGQRRKQRQHVERLMLWRLPVQVRGAGSAGACP